MKKTIFILLLSGISVWGNAQNVVTTQNRTILVNDQPYYIRGICYNPIKIGETRTNMLDFSHIDTDIALMKKACINTVRFYEPFDDTAIFSKFANAGIKLIINFPNYDDTKLYVDISSGSYLDYIKKYMDNPAVLMWELGNEYNYHPEWFNNDVNNWYTILNNAADQIHSIDPNHPVSTANGEVPSSAELAACPNVDVWGLNVYEWDDPSGVAPKFDALSTKPFYLSETGTDRFDNNAGQEDDAAQAKAEFKIINTMLGDSNNSGLFIFEFADEWWKVHRT